MKNREARCSNCHQPIKTVLGAMRLNNSPLICRKCFGVTTYDTSEKWKIGNDPVNAQG
jgi:hypothetical protein